MAARSNGSGAAAGAGRRATATLRCGGRPVLRSNVVRVGFLTHLLWDRYGPFWTTLTVAAGSEVALPDPDDVVGRLADPRVAVAPTVAFRLAVAAALALEDVDLLVAPSLNPDDGATRGAAQDPWVADLPTMLARSVPGLPPVWAVPADLGRSVESEAIPFLRRLTPDVGAVRRAWSQHRAEARPPRRTRRGVRQGPPGEATVAVLGQPWWATPAVAALVARPGEHAVGPYAYDPADLRAEARRVDPALVDTDAEALGALRRFARSGAVGALRWVVDGASGSDLWLSRRAHAIAGARVELVSLRELAEPERTFRALLHPGGSAP